MKKRPAAEGASCDWQAPARGQTRDVSKPGPRIHRHRPDYSWSGVRTERYKSPDGTWSDVLRRSLAGTSGEQTKFHFRYFEISPGGHTTLETHRHEHVVVVVRGRGRCLVNRKKYTLGYLDTVYIPPKAEHQLMNPFDEPFGFFCIVDARRDRPKPSVKGKGCR